MALRYFLIIGLCAGFASCNKGTEPEPVNYYPMSAGDSWTYAGVDSEYNFRPLTPGALPLNRKYHSIHRVTALGLQTLPDSTSAWQIQSDDSTWGFHGTSDRYYRIEHDTLKFVAYKGYSTALPKRSPQFSYLFNGQRFGSIAELAAAFRVEIPGPSSGQSEIVLLETPSRILAFPLQVNKMWEVLNTSFAKIRKKVVGTETFRTPAGSFLCYKIQYLGDVFGDGSPDEPMQQFDLVCTKGLIRRELYVRNLTFYTAQDPEPISMVDIMSIRTLTNINIHPTDE